VKRKPRLFFSFRSPYSWLAVERMQQVVPGAHDLIEFIPFWEPDSRTRQALKERGADLHYVQMSKAKHLYILQDTKRLAMGLGLRVVWPIDTESRWEIPHLGWLQARRLGLGFPFYAAVTAARWKRGENICDREVIKALAASVGIDGDVVVNAAEDPDIQAEAVDCLVDAYEDDIFGVPYFRLGWHRFWGFDRLDEFLTVLLPKRIGHSDGFVTDTEYGRKQRVVDAAGGHGADAQPPDSLSEISPDAQSHV